MRNRTLGCTQGPGARPTHSAPRRILGALLCLLPVCALAATDPFAGPADPAAAPYRVVGSGFVTDSGHPRHPGDFTRVEIAVRLCVNPGLGESLIEVVKTPHELCPDALGRDPQPLRLERVPEKKRLEDATNALDIYNVESGHTDEYLIFYFPRQKVLFNGDLLFYRPGKPLSARSQQLCGTVQKLGLDVASYYCTWPLDGYGTRNVVTAEEMRNACGTAN